MAKAPGRLSNQRRIALLRDVSGLNHHEEIRDPAKALARSSRGRKFSVHRDSNHQEPRSKNHSPTCRRSSRAEEAAQLWEKRLRLSLQGDSSLQRSLDVETTLSLGHTRS